MDEKEAQEQEQNLAEKEILAEWLKALDLLNKGKG